MLLMVGVNYEAAWIPESVTDADADLALELGGRWLANVKGVEQRIIGMNAVKMAGNSTALSALCTRFPVYSPQSARPPLARSAVLAVYPSQETLDWAEQLASRGALCVIAWTQDYTPWVVRSGATNLFAPGDPPPKLAELPDEVKGVLDRLLFFGGHNRFAGADEKQRAMTDLKRIMEHGRPAIRDIEAYLLASGETDQRGARRVREWYEGLLRGQRFKDYRGRYI